MTRLRFVLMLGTALPAACFTTSAIAADDVVAAADAVDAGDGSGLGEIVVTATKRETDLQQTPIAISVVNSQLIKDRHVQSLYDLADGGVPSLRVATFEARQSALTIGIRGIVPFDANQTARDQGVGVYVDGVYLGRQQGLNAALFDVERIEVLRGPQGTLFGRNTEGGALSIVTKAPTGEFGGRVSAGVGNYGSYNGEAHIDFPAFANLAVKLDGVMQHQGATTKNPLAGQKGWNYFNRVGGRAAVRWTPFDGFTADLSYDRSKDENTPFYSQLVNYNPLGRTVGVYDANGKLVAPPGGTCTPACIAPLSPLVVVSGDNRMKVADIGVPQQPSVDRTSGFTGILKYEPTPDLELRSITAWRKVSTHQWDNSGGAHRTIFAPNTNFSRYSLSELFQNQFSQELQAVGSFPQLDYVVGAYYFKEHASEAAATPSSNRWNADATGYTVNSPIVFGPITSGNQGWDRSSWFVQRDSRAEATSYAVFGQFTFTPARFDIFHLTAGARYTHDKRDGLLFVVQNKPTNYGFHFSANRVDPLVTAAIDVTPDVHLYAKYATGYRAGGANDRSQTFNAFGPESVRSYEAGAKLDLFDRRVRLNLAGYIMDRKGTQTDFDNVDTRPTLPDGSPNPTFNLHTEETRNAPGISRIRGVEADLTVQPVDNLTMGASYAYTYTRVPPTPNPFLNNAPFQVYTVFTPRNAASGFIDYEVPVAGNGARLRFHLDANYADPQYSFQSEPVKTDSSFIVNGRIALADIPVNGSGTTATLSVWTRNLFNETHIYRRSAANAAILGDYANFNPPRTFGGEVAIRF
ncbi:putative TonB-dependent receptor [Sphingomonas changbaiensis NBRC 104936]|uniref:Putative TonB-dependent receptor n=1 Tax=Sphingomonas changbaiensis NBRC 104936 TaxID=1219043 RepID=A0A0E9ML80_9SPHN|nr:TonB-dependent receptor [Sphingomonas changbaiensis]GAO38176.1 putative TonB-dependent receptor [Sphingomonas changbaiensis NBRC 104936]